MATVHPSRLGLVPQSSSFKNEGRYNGVDRDNSRERRKEHDSSYRRDDSRERDHDRKRDYPSERRRERSRSPNNRGRARDDDKRAYDREERQRRSSPDYSAYRKEEPPHRVRPNGADDARGVDAPAPWRAPENMYGSRGRGRTPAPGGDDYFASRRAMRASKEVNIWPPSPKEPSDLSESKKKRSTKRGRSLSVSTSSSEERERRKKKEKRRKEKRDREERKEKHRRKHRREKSYDDDSEDNRRHRRRRSRSYRRDEDSDDERRSRRSRSKSEKRQEEKSRHKSRHSSRADTPPRSHVDEEEADWVEKPADSFVAVAEHTGKSPHMDSVTNIEEKKEGAAGSESESDWEEVGPQPVYHAPTMSKKVDERQYGGALLRGEGSAMAAFLRDGDTDARIPRRGEIGLTPDEIAAYESVGYVMSGSRHRRMNAVRMRKENQVISAEEKRGILKLQKEERERREAILRDEFRELVEEKLK
ncbi:DUF926-domain-containing protein [Sanghuangporus baumii]|uniref:DUF926-domain-containing protein n=1 Tax=Sanghuangporus baumii TaxID=108892 RepID=A0A9Q5HVS5_SANBA|nr:DUF926-domain-containing protein [Sanghuangporus baumii]